MQELFKPELRDKAIDTTCSNLVMAGLLKIEEVPEYMAKITRLNDWELAEQLCTSRLLLDNYYENCWNLN